MKVVINEDFGGFDLSDVAFEKYLDLKGIEWCRVSHSGFSCYYQAGHMDESDYYLCVTDIERNDPALIQVVEELGEEANGTYSSLKVIEIPDDIKWHIAEYDGREHVAENHRTWD